MLNQILPKFSYLHGRALFSPSFHQMIFDDCFHSRLHNQDEPDRPIRVHRGLLGPTISGLHAVGKSSGLRASAITKVGSILMNTTVSHTFLPYFFSHSASTPAKSGSPLSTTVAVPCTVTRTSSSLV